MANPPRVHVPGGTYYLFRRTDPSHPIFAGPEDYARFEDLLELSLDSSEAKLLGFCWLPNAIHLVIQIADGPIAGFMRTLMWRYSRGPWQRADQTRPWFRERYHATLVQADLYLETLISHLHYLPVRAGLAASPGDYPHSSHHAYLSHRTDTSVYTRRLLRSLGCIGKNREPYCAATARTPSESFGRLFERGLPDSPGIMGDPAFVSARQIGARGRRSTLHHTRSLDKLINQVAERHGISLDELCSKFRRRELVLARAQITWFAILWEVASVNDIARRLHHSPSTLSRAVARHKRWNPELFRPEAISRANPAPWSQMQAAAE